MGNENTGPDFGVSGPKEPGQLDPLRNLDFPDGTFFLIQCAPYNMWWKIHRLDTVCS